MLKELTNWKVASPLDPQAKLSSLISLEHLEKVLKAINEAKKLGGTILFGGERVRLNKPYDQGAFLQPTLIEGLSVDCATNQNEIFGPVATITPFKDEEEVLEYANSVNYGLSASVWTQDCQRAINFSKNLESGMVWINGWNVRDLRTPFGGVKHSGLGREGGLSSLHFFTEPQNICFNLES